jgi:Mg2+ and Co2+ transporter CorA
MLNIFTLANGRLFQEEIESLEELSQFQPIWVDLESPTLEEKRWVAQHFGLSIPDDAMDEDIEESARFYEEDNGDLHIRSDFLIADEDASHSVRVAFIISQHNIELKSRGVLFSIHADRTACDTTKNIAPTNHNSHLYTHARDFGNFFNHTHNGCTINAKRIITHQGFTRKFQQNALIWFCTIG